MAYADLFARNDRFRQIDVIRGGLKDASKASDLEGARRGVCETLSMMWVAGLKAPGGSGAASLQAMQQQGTDTPGARAYWRQVFAQQVHGLDAMNRFNEAVRTDPTKSNWEREHALIDPSAKFRLRLQSFSGVHAANRNVQFEGYSCPNPDVVAPLLARQQLTYIVEIYRNYFEPDRRVGHNVVVEHDPNGFQLFDSNFGLAHLTTANELRDAMAALFSHYRTEYVKIYRAD